MAGRRNSSRDLAKNNPLSCSINKLIKARHRHRHWPEAALPLPRHGVGWVQVLAHGWVKVTLLHRDLSVWV